MKRELHNDPGSAERNERARWRIRAWTWIALLSLPVCLLTAWWGAHYALRGDYLQGARLDYWSRALRLTASPIPTHEGLMHPSGTAPFLVGPDGQFLAFKAGYNGKNELFQFTDLPGEPPYERLFGELPDGGRMPIERYPVGALRDAMAAWQSRRLPAFLAEAERLQKRFPERVTPKYWIVATLFELGRREEAIAQLDAWRSDFANHASWRGAWYLLLLENDVLASTPEQLALREERREYVEYVPGGAPRARGLAEHLDWFAAQRGRAPSLSLSLRDEVPNFLDYQVGTKAARVEAIFAMARGERQRAADLALGAAAAGLDLQEGTATTEIGALVAIACVSIASGGVADLFAHGNASAEELEAIWPDLAAVAAAMEALDETRMRAIAFPWSMKHPTHPSAMDPLRLEPIARGLVARAQIDLVREALRARHHQQRFAAWPPITPIAGIEGDLLAADPPIVDPFEAPLRPLRAERTTDTLRLWSIGPDKTNDGGAFSYDPTNGTYSAGDVIIELEDAPRYDWPREPGYVYASLDDWRVRYRHGLPTDPFANGGLAALRLEPLETSFAGSLRLWSFGADADEGTRAYPYPGEHLLRLYDPTNGTISRGDLWTALPFAAADPASPFAPTYTSPPSGAPTAPPWRAPGAFGLAPAPVANPFFGATGPPPWAPTPFGAIPPSSSSPFSGTPFGGHSIPFGGSAPSSTAPFGSSSGGSPKNPFGP